MITSANDNSNFINIISSLQSNDPFACRIISLYLSYDPKLVFVDYWLISNQSGDFCGAIARNGSVFIVFLRDDSCVSEVSSFIRVAGATSVLCSDKYPLELPVFNSFCGSVLMRNKPFDEINNGSDYYIPSIRSAYNLISSCADDNFTPPSFDDFYVDVNHKLRHNTMRMYGIRAGDRLAAVAMTVAECNSGAVLGAVACSAEFRKHGYGSNIVKFLTDKLISEGKTVFLHRAENANAVFYEKLGFVEIDKWREYYFGG